MPVSTTSQQPIQRPRRAKIKWRDVGMQTVVLAIVLTMAFAFATNVIGALQARGINISLGFLFQESGFRIGESLVPYAPTDNILKAILVGFGNTLKVSVFSVVAATIIGLIVGIGQMARNSLISSLCTMYVAVFRNTPQLVQISFLYLLITRLPGVRQAVDLAGVGHLSNRGFVFPWLPPGHSTNVIVLTCVASVVAALGWVYFTRRYRRRTGNRLPSAPIILALLVIPVTLAWFALGRPLALEYPELKGFNFKGGAQWSTEFLTLFLGLSLYIAAFVAEIVRSGIQATTKGQIEAAQSIGLGQADILAKIVLPQAMRVMMPPLTAQYVSLAKNSSLGVIIGYPELFNISSTALTLSGHVVECLVIMAGMYLAMSLVISTVGNTINHAFRIQER